MTNSEVRAIARKSRNYVSVSKMSSNQAVGKKPGRSSFLPKEYVSIHSRYVPAIFCSRPGFESSSEVLRGGHGPRKM